MQFSLTEASCKIFNYFEKPNDEAAIVSAEVNKKHLFNLLLSASSNKKYSMLNNCQYVLNK